MTVIEMRQELGSLVEKMSALNDRASKEQRDLTMAEQEQWERLEREVRRLDGQIARDEMSGEACKPSWRKPLFTTVSRTRAAVVLVVAAMEAVTTRLPRRAISSPVIKVLKRRSEAADRYMIGRSSKN